MAWWYSGDEFFESHFSMGIINKYQCQSGAASTSALLLNVHSLLFPRQILEELKKSFCCSLTAMLKR